MSLVHELLADETAEHDPRPYDPRTVPRRLGLGSRFALPAGPLGSTPRSGKGGVVLACWSHIFEGRRAELLKPLQPDPIEWVFQRVVRDSLDTPFYARPSRTVRVIPTLQSQRPSARFKKWAEYEGAALLDAWVLGLIPYGGADAPSDTALWDSLVTLANQDEITGTAAAELSDWLNRRLLERAGCAWPAEQPTYSA